jgi:NAD(P)-dependent dehydrogenase (short-subunit alcohol dehydrogenase family)
MSARAFDGKVVVITGAGGGIGRAAATQFATQGARLTLVDVQRSALDESAAAVAKAGGRALVVEADVTQDADVARYVAETVRAFGGIDGFFNNAGVLGAVKAIAEYPEVTFDRVMAVNVKGVWLGLKHVAPALRARGGGAVVNTASIAGLRGTPNLVAYTASKHAVIGITRTASLELARHHIRVNAVCPAPIDTAMAAAVEQGFRPADPGAFRERLSATIPLGRYGRPEEVAALVVFLCGDDASYLTGGVYTVDGGAMA